ncbi:hypothetical protein EDB84DRAFT_384987 [Lactarius hengduanensis]|nr:hypothetical protein EDB84DRAFT_384987 [Lactarius hengduanensis]
MWLYSSGHILIPRFNTDRSRVVQYPDWLIVPSLFGSVPQSVFGSLVPTALLFVISSILPSSRVSAVPLTFVEIEPLGAKGLLALLVAPITLRPVPIALILRNFRLASARVLVPTTTRASVFAASVAPLGLAVVVTTAPLGARTDVVLLAPRRVVGSRIIPVALPALSLVLACAVRLFLRLAVLLLSFRAVGTVAPFFLALATRIVLSVALSTAIALLRIRVAALVGLGTSLGRSVFTRVPRASLVRFLATVGSLSRTVVIPLFASPGVVLTGLTLVSRASIPRLGLSFVHSASSVVRPALRLAAFSVRRRFVPSWVCKSGA